MKNEWFKQYFDLQYIIGDNNQSFGFNNLKERTRCDIKQIIKLGKVKKHDKILDIPCGYGRHAIELASKFECKIIGIDINSKLIKVANYRTKNKLNVEEKLIKLKTKPKFKVADLKNFSNKKELANFDLIYSWFWSFGYFSDDENHKVFQEFYKALKSKGNLLIHTIPKENLKKYLVNEKRIVFSTKIFDKQYPKGILYFEKKYNAQNSKLYCKWQIKLNDGKIIPKKPVKSEIIIYSSEEYIKMLKDAGFKKIKIYKSYFPLKIFKATKI